MYLKKRIDLALKELNEKYHPVAEAKEAAKPILKEIYNPKLPKHQIDDLIRRTEGIYQEYLPAHLRTYHPWNIS